MAVMYERSATLTMGRAARELSLKSGEFDLAAQLGEVYTVPPGPGDAQGRQRVPQEEIERLRGEEGFPDTLRERIRVVGTTEAAALLDIGPGRFLRLARSGCFGPVRFYVNRYGAVVWQYLASELTALAERDPGLVHGPTPPAMRAALADGQDWRGRQWRSRRVDQLVEEAADAWSVAAAVAAVLPPDEVASLVRDPAERAWLRKLRPRLSSTGANSPAAREAVERAETAEDVEEVMWYRVSLSRHLQAARRERLAPLPRPTVGPPRPAHPMAAATAPTDVSPANALRAARRKAARAAGPTGGRPEPGLRASRPAPPVPCVAAPRPRAAVRSRRGSPFRDVRTAPPVP